MTVADSRCQTLQQQNAPAGTGAVLMLNQAWPGGTGEKECVAASFSHRASGNASRRFVTCA
jgi:hypothetical protein